MFICNYQLKLKIVNSAVQELCWPLETHQKQYQQNTLHINERLLRLGALSIRVGCVWDSVHLKKTFMKKMCVISKEALSYTNGRKLKPTY